MTAHDLARALLAGPDLPVVINGWGSDEGLTYEVKQPGPPEHHTYTGANDSKATPRNAHGWQLPRPSIALEQCDERPKR